MSDYTVAAIIYVLLTGGLVATLLIGGFLLLNAGLMSKRESDRVGGFKPSDVGFLRSTVWPEEPSVQSTLPAEDWDPGEDLASGSRGGEAARNARLQAREQGRDPARDLARDDARAEDPSRPQRDRAA